MNTKRKLTTTALAAGALALASSLAAAQYVGPGTTPVYTSIAEVLRSAPDDAAVDLQGTLVKQVGKEKYLLSDGKDQIRVEIDAKDFPTVRIDEHTQVRIRGEVEKDFLESPEIDVEHLSVV